jgi:putative membrane-bound dehydrogenase-like protein
MLAHWSFVLRHSSLVLVWSLVIGHWSFAADVAKPLSPEDAQRAFVLADSNLKIELVASEPQAIDPVAIRFDEDGRMWVVEMRDYPLGNPNKGGEPLSRIRVLEDKDNDGLFESATTFADKLLFVTGVQPWKGGVFVTLSGRLAYMKDTDGDGRVDVDETWFEGFAELNSQLRANHPRLALDNWIYVANGLRGGKVVNKKLGQTEPINISGMDFRFNPLTGACEAVTGNGQFGLCFDDWGNRFNCSNRNPVRHVVIEDRYLKANPSVTVSATVNDVAAFGEQSHIFPISRAWTTSNLHAGQFTAACGVYVYRGDLLPAEFKGNVFTCDPTGNLIHREIMQPAGPTFTSKAAYDGKEFLASPDEWFRPVNMELGPDGALYVVDMYRCVIEHPDFVPDELKRRPDLRLGDDRGRIWRIVPNSGRSGPDRPASRLRPALSRASSDDLVPLLDHPNAWQRETAQRLLLDREWRKPDDLLVRLVSQSTSPQGTIHALSLLRSISEDQVWKWKLLPHLLANNHPQVRRHGLFAASSGVDFNYARPGLTDAAPEVRFAARLCVPSTRDYSTKFEGPGSDWGSWYPSMMSDANDQWQRFAMRVLLANPSHAGAFERYVLLRATKGPRATPGARLLIREIKEEEVAGAPLETANRIAFAGTSVLARDPALAIEALLGGMKGLNRRKISPHDEGIVSEETKGISIAAVRAEAQRLTSDATLEAGIRRDAIELLSYLPGSSEILLELGTSAQDQPTRIAAIVALARQSRLDDWEAILSRFSAETPPIRRAVIDAMLPNPDRTKLILDAIEAGKIKPYEMDQLQVKRLIENRDPKIKDRAQKLLAAAMPADRAKALADYQPVLQMKGHATHGQAVFEKNCAACHRIAGIGVNVAPDISDSRMKKPEQILADIVQPNRAIDNNYLGYTVRQLDGTVLTGILATETATSITLRQQGGKEAVIPRAEIDELRSSGQSLMPEGLERQIPPQDMADLLAFIKNWRYLDGRTPLSQ